MTKKQKTIDYILKDYPISYGTKQQIKFAIEEIVREVIGEETDLMSQGNSPELVRGFNQAKQEIRQKCKKLGIKI